MVNYRPSRARQQVESAFGILSNKWRILHRQLEQSYENNLETVQACCFLHNILLRKNPITQKELDSSSEMIPITAGGGLNASGNKEARLMRQKLADYFMGEGAVDFQWDKI